MALFPKVFRHRFVVFAHDILMIPVGWLGAHALRFGWEALNWELLRNALTLLPWVVTVQAFLFWQFGLYRGIWRFASLPDLARIIKSAGVGLAATALFLFLINRMEHVPRTVFPIYAMLLIVLLGSSRFIYRWRKDSGSLLATGKRVLIVGAGDTGEHLVRALSRDAQGSYTPVGFIDDNPNVQGKEIQGIRVLGRRGDIPSVVVERSIDAIIIAITQARPLDMQEIVAICERTGVPVNAVPSLAEFVGGSGFRDSLRFRKLAVEDLLGRDPISPDWQRIRGTISGRRILVSGGGGSIGSELCLQIASLKPEALIVLDISEYNLFELRENLNQRFPHLKLHIKLVDVADKAAVSQVFRELHPDMVFHAAAYKHVPMLEGQLRSAVKNNVIGTRTMVDLAHEFGVKGFVLISTDKAVNPTNIMGMSKRVAEVYCQNMNGKSKTRYMTVRFGNVLGSTGSVVPLFRRQIETGGPVTITHPDITRYFMTISEAAQLILESAAMGEGGEIFVLDMGQPVKISYLAEMMIRMAGMIPGRDVDIVYTGLRPGEKLHEELFHEHEKLLETDCRKIFRANSRDCSIPNLPGVMEQLEQACSGCDDPRMAGILIQLVPEFRGETVVSEHGVGNVIHFQPGARKGSSQ